MESLTVFQSLPPPPVAGFSLRSSSPVSFSLGSALPVLSLFAPSWSVGGDVPLFLSASSALPSFSSFSPPIASLLISDELFKYVSVGVSLPAISPPAPVFSSGEIPPAFFSVSSPLPFSLPVPPPALSSIAHLFFIDSVFVRVRGRII